MLTKGQCQLCLPWVLITAADEVWLIWWGVKLRHMECFPTHPVKVLSEIYKSSWAVWSTWDTTVEILQDMLDGIPVLFATESVRVRSLVEPLPLQQIWMGYNGNRFENRFGWDTTVNISTNNHDESFDTYMSVWSKSNFSQILILMQLSD